MQRKFRNSRNETDDESTNHHHYGIGSIQLPRQDSKRHDKKQQQKEDDLDRVDLAAFHLFSVSMVKIQQFSSAGACRLCAPVPRVGPLMARGMISFRQLIQLQWSLHN